MFARSAIRAATRSTRTSAVRTFATRATNNTKTFNYATVGAAALTAAAVYQAISNKQTIQCQGSLAGVQGTETERTFIAVKPDGVQRALVGDVIARFEKRGYKLAGLKLVVPPKELAHEHYADLSSKPFFAGLVDYMTNGRAPVVAMVWEGLDVIKQGRAMIGATNPLAAAPGTIRGDYCTSMGRNIIHGSDSFDSASKEIGLWFGQPGELVNWSSNNAEWIFSKN